MFTLITILACFDTTTPPQKTTLPEDTVETKQTPQSTPETTAQVATPVIQEESPHPVFAFPTHTELATHPNKEKIERGLQLVSDTYRQLPNNVGNTMNCTSCHLEGGTRPNAMTFVGVLDRYPTYRSRSGKIDNIQERINGCFRRSMNGTPLDEQSPEMEAIVDYMTWVSSKVKQGDKLKEAGVQLLTPLVPDTQRGEQLYTQKCSACHQAEGQGISLPDGKTIYPALWGEKSFNIGAGMARLDKASAFIKWNMPLGQGGTLTDQEAFDIAAYFINKPRPDFEDKVKDWPKGEKPATARY